MIATQPIRPSSDWRPSPTARRRILIVDDNTTVTAILSTILTKVWNHDVRIAHGGAAALAAGREFHPEIVLLDIGMPGLSGYDVARRWREEQGDEPLLVALTGHSQERDRRRALAAGFDVHMSKPVSVPALEELFTHPKLNRTCCTM